MKNDFLKYGWTILLIVITVTSVFIGGFSYRLNNAIPRGILGGITIFLLYYFGTSARLDVSNAEFLRDSRKGKFYIAAIIVPAISYWAAAQIYEMIIFLKTLNN